MRYSTDEKLTPEQLTLINEECTKLPPADALFCRQQGGMYLTYIDSVWTISRMNAIFGVEGWSHNISDEKLLYETEADGKWKCSYKVTVCVNAVGQYHEDIGVGHGTSKDRGKALEGAILEAPTDAMKRACRYYGKSLGLALYSEMDRTQIFLDSIAAVKDAEDYEQARLVLGKLKPSFKDDQSTLFTEALLAKKKALGL